MNTEGVLAELMLVAESIGLEVRHGALRGNQASQGGLCRVQGRSVAVLSTKATGLERCGVLAQALAELGHAEHPALGPDSRALVERRGRPRSGKAPVERPKETRPGLAGLGRDGRRRP